MLRLSHKNIIGLFFKYEKEHERIRFVVRAKPVCNIIMKNETEEKQ